MVLINTSKIADSAKIGLEVVQEFEEFEADGGDSVLEVHSAAAPENKA